MKTTRHSEGVEWHHTYCAIASSPCLAALRGCEMTSYILCNSLISLPSLAALRGCGMTSYILCNSLISLPGQKESKSKIGQVTPTYEDHQTLRGCGMTSYILCNSLISSPGQNKNLKSKSKSHLPSRCWVMVALKDLAKERLIWEHMRAASYMYQV